MGIWQLVPGQSPEPVPKVPSPLTSQRVKAGKPKLSYCFLYAKPFLVSLSPALINVFSRSTGLVKSILNKVKAPHTTAGSRQTHSGPGPCLVTVALFIIATRWKQPKCPTAGEHTSKMQYIYAMGYYLATERNKVLICSKAQIHHENIMLNEKVIKGWYCMIPFIWNVHNR